jgi:SAM-dependent methyltransferase
METEETPSGRIRCPLCHGDEVAPLATVQGKEYLECRTCGLAFLQPEARLDSVAERARYELHENDPGDLGYRDFLGRLARPLIRRLQPGAHGLDYGSGPGPTLSLMLEEKGFPMEIYDPFFAPDPAVLERRYDFVTCTETAEHFHDPAREFGRLHRLIRPGGWLGVMTETREPERSFQDWHYVREPTHVCFYQARTMEWVATRHGWELERPGRTVFLFRRQRDGEASP